MGKNSSKFMLFFFLLFLLIVSLPYKVLGFESFNKSDKNPLHVNYLPDYNSLLQSNIYKDENLFKGIISTRNSTSGKYSLAYVTSPDGYSWNMEKIILILESDLFAPKVYFLNENNIRLFFTKDDKPLSIYFVDCDINYNCQQNPTSVLKPDLNDPSESNGVFNGFPVYKNGRYYLFFGTWGSRGFIIKLASSTDGLSWVRCSSDPIIFNADSPFYFEYYNNSYLFFHTFPKKGIAVTSIKDPLSCQSIYENQEILVHNGPEYYDMNNIINASVFVLDNQLYLYYSGQDNNYNWTLNLATSGSPPIPSDNPIILLPGLFGSWNKEAILHGKQVDRKSWKLTPIAKEYNGLKATFSNLGYQENEDYYLFAYDWRKNIDSIATDLNSYIQEDVLPTHPNSKLSLVGHSLGGLVARIYGQKYQDNSIDKLITVGSPHQGTAHIYKAVEAGELDKSDTLFWLAQRFILQRHKNKKESNKQVISEKFPVAQDLFPTYNFLYDQNNNEINVQNMQIKNNLLPTYDQTFPGLFPVLQTIVGEKGNTLSGYKVGQRTDKDILLDLYPDGRPTETKTEIGDYVITSRSAKADTDFSTLNLDHDQLVYKEEGIKSILNSLQVTYQDSQIIEGGKTNIFPSIIFLILSSAKLEVDFNGQPYQEEDGIVFIENAQEGIYQLRAIGQELGFYNIIIGQIGTDEDAWSEISGEITQSPPTSQIDTYTVNYDPQNPVEFPVNQTDPTSLFDILITHLNQINQNLKNRNINQALEYLQKSKQNYLEEKGNDLRRNLIQVHRNLFQAISQSSDQDLINSIGQLENLYDKSLTGFLPKPSYSFLQKELERYQRAAASTQESLLSQKQRGKDVTLETNLLLLAEEKISKAESALSQYNLDLAEILLKSAKELLK